MLTGLIPSRAQRSKSGLNISELTTQNITVSSLLQEFCHQQTHHDMKKLAVTSVPFIDRPCQYFDNVSMNVILYQFEVLNQILKVEKICRLKREGRFL